MEQPFSQKKHNAHISWEDALTEDDHISDWHDSAFQAAVDKLDKEHGTADTVMRTGEAFGRGLYAQKVKEKSAEWTIKEWLQEIEKDVFKPLGTEFTFTKVSHDVATTFMNRNPIHQLSADRSVESLFNLGVMRGLFLSAFPKGELVLNESTAISQPEFILKTHASAIDKFERERQLQRFNRLKKDTDV
jgi:hypothetical protein